MCGTKRQIDGFGHCNAFYSSGQSETAAFQATAIYTD